MAEFDKYKYYLKSVQSADVDAEFLDLEYRHLRRGKRAKILREDFCGTFAVCAEWVKRSPNHHAIAVDNDEEPLVYGRRHVAAAFTKGQLARLKTHRANVLEKGLPRADVICALNFSYFILRERAQMLQYFKRCVATLNEGGVFFLDCFGGTQTQEANEEETVFTDEKFSYFWDQESFDPVTYHARFAIHFRERGKRKHLRAFTYDWRMWSIPELRDLLLEAGFKDARVYWEGTTKNGEGDGQFEVVSKGEACESWIAYIAALK